MGSGLADALRVSVNDARAAWNARVLLRAGDADRLRDRGSGEWDGRSWRAGSPQDSS